jgi:lysyl-tRNA synthetase class 2
VYEINRNFRNEGISTQHNPEFTMLEFYQAYSNYHDLMDLTEEIIKYVAMEVNGTTKTTFNDVEIDLGKWTKLSMREAIIKWWPIEAGNPPVLQDFDSTFSFAKYIANAENHYVNMVDRGDGTFVVRPSPALDNKNLGSKFHLLIQRIRESLFAKAEIEDSTILGKSITELFEFIAEPHLIQPTIIYDFPLAVSPLSKIKPEEPEWVERFEFYIGGFEVGNAFSELNDPVDQHRRFEDQLKEKARGDEEAMQMDEDYVRALGYGLPPTAGEGIGVDRLTMILTGSKSIRDVILFPLLRPPKPRDNATELDALPGTPSESEPS